MYMLFEVRNRKYVVDSTTLKKIEELIEKIRKEINNEGRRLSRQKKILIIELLILKEEGIRSPRGGLWKIFTKTAHTDAVWWYKHIREVALLSPTFEKILQEMNVKIFGTEPEEEKSEKENKELIKKELLKKAKELKSRFIFS